MLKNIILVQLWVFTVVPIFSQSPIKIGFADSEFILLNIPDTKQAENIFEEYEKEIQKEFEIKEEIFREEFTDYMDERSSCYPSSLSSIKKKEEKLQRLQQELQKFQQEAMINFEQKKQKLLSPIYEKIQKGIEEVAKENGYTHILPSNTLIYASEDAPKIHDISEKVIAKLGGTMPKEEE